jgi:hypothetical protein
MLKGLWVSTSSSKNENENERKAQRNGCIIACHHLIHNVIKMSFSFSSWKRFNHNPICGLRNVAQQQEKKIK